MLRPRADLALIGPYPPPYGGISIHLKRLAPLLEREGIRWTHYNISSATETGKNVRSVYRFRRAWLAALPITARERVLHFHAPDDVLARSVSLPVTSFRRSKVIHSFHNSRTIVDPGSLSPIRHALLRHVLRAAAAVHVVNPALVDALARFDVPPERVFAYPAFLPPDPTDEEAKAFPPHLVEFLQTHRPSLVAIGDPRRLWRGQPIYGLEGVVDLVEALQGELPEIGLLIFLHIGSSLDDRETRALSNRIERKGLSQRVRVMELRRECWPAFTHADLYVRPTLTDGDAVAVREALWLGTPVVATDVGARPEGTILCPVGDASAFIDAVREAWANIGEAKDRVGALRPEDPSERVLAMYRSVLGRT
ncbi:MAG: glycosyltransferase family 4 protein [Deltaproteobacteria bacterium]|nr:glycosyltransferase family 4 protein [Deltaproteobacteria bacterium]MBW2256960.1 glycosyltransferase family 4 protein [Deltaproteobacteria bacterium]